MWITVRVSLDYQVGTCYIVQCLQDGRDPMSAGALGALSFFGICNF